MFDLTRLNRYKASEANINYIDGAVVNSYAPVTAISNNSITIDKTKMIEGGHVQFTVGTEVFVHVSGSRDGTSKTYLGYWVFAEITAVSGNTISIDRDITATIPARILSSYYVQAITVPFFYGRGSDNPVQSSSIAPPAFDVSKMCGGILVLKCQYLYMGTSSTMKYFYLVDKGIPTTHKSLRPWFNYEQQGMLDTDAYSGWENAMLEHRLPLNVGDGAALLYSSSGGSFSYAHVGNNSAKGVRYCRGASDSTGTPSNVTNIGGSTVIEISAARTAAIDYANHARKYRSTSSELGQGLGARLFVTANISSVNSNDGGLYSHMKTHTSTFPTNWRLTKTFGDGSFGNCSGAAATKQMNNYALVTNTATSASFTTKTLSYAKKTVTGLAQIAANALVLVQVFNTNTWHTVSSTLCNVVSDNGAAITVDKKITLGTNLQAMIVSIPQFKNYTLSAQNDATPKYSGGIGGIFAIAVSNLCNLSAGSIRMWGRGGVPINITDPSLIERHDVLTLGSGIGSILILANKLTMNTDTRLGLTGYNHGNKTGGRGMNGSVSGGTFKPSNGALGGGYRGVSTEKNTGGYGGAGGTGSHKGGFLSSGTHDADITNATNFGLQGAHLMIIADTITNFNINAIATGGAGYKDAYYGGAGYGGGGAGNGAGGGYRGGGAGDIGSGGSAGYAFIWCNTAVNQINDGIVLDE